MATRHATTATFNAGGDALRAVWAAACLLARQPVQLDSLRQHSACGIWLSQESAGGTRRGRGHEVMREVMMEVMREEGHEWGASERLHCHAAANGLVSEHAPGLRRSTPRPWRAPWTCSHGLAVGGHHRRADPPRGIHAARRTAGTAWRHAPQPLSALHRSYDLVLEALELTKHCHSS